MPSTLSSGPSASDTTNTTMVEYEVLYYQRKNKVHKSKGVSKFDGILSISVATGVIRLKASDFDDDDNDNHTHNDDDDSDSDSDDENTSKKKAFAKKMKKRQQKRPAQKKSSSNTNTAAVPYSGKDKALAQRCCGTRPLQEDDIIVLGGYEVQIVACCTANQTPTAILNKRPDASIGSTGLKLKSSTQLVRRKVIAKPLQSTSAKIGTKATAAGISTTTNHTRKPLVTSSSSLSNTTKPQPSLLHKRPAGPLKSRTSTLIKKRPSSLHSSLHPAKKTLTTKTASINNNAGTAATTMICPGINLPASIRTVLRPHQVHGVEFLWKALTTTTSSKTSNHSSKKGCILADEMVILPILVFRLFWT